MSGRHRKPPSPSVNVAKLAFTGAVIGGGGLALAGHANAASDGEWDQVARCESGGNWAINTGNGFQGGLQFTPGTWAGHGGGQFAPAANMASKDQQIAIAERVLGTQGRGAWPVCGHGLSSASPRNVLPASARVQDADAPAPDAVPADAPLPPPPDQGVVETAALDAPLPPPPDAPPAPAPDAPPAPAPDNVVVPPPAGDPALPPPADAVIIDTSAPVDATAPQAPDSAVVTKTSLDAPLAPAPNDPGTPPPPPAPGPPAPDPVGATANAMPNIPAPVYDAANQAMTTGQVPGAAAGVPHLPSPDNLPPDTTETNPSAQPGQGPNMTYLHELWQAVRTQQISPHDAVLGFAQRPLDAAPPPGQAAGPQESGPAPGPVAPAPTP